MAQVVSASHRIRPLTPVQELYDDPESFIPDRYLLTKNGTKPEVDGSDLRPNLGFGVGRVSFTSSLSPFLAYYPATPENLPRHSFGAELH
jgi:hypothetical protein